MKLVFALGGQQEVDDYEQNRDGTILTGIYVLRELRITNSAKSKKLRPDP